VNVLFVMILFNVFFNYSVYYVYAMLRWWWWWIGNNDNITSNKGYNAIKSKYIKLYILLAWSLWKLCFQPARSVLKIKHNKTNAVIVTLTVWGVFW